MLSKVISKLCNKRKREEDVFTSMVDLYDVDMDQCIGSVMNAESFVERPEGIVRPPPYDKLCVEVGDEDKVEEWEDDVSKSVYLEMPEGGREDRLVYLQYLDQIAYCDSFGEGNQGHSPPRIHS